eukprot:948974-Pelagomonas_calceolata.AAC.2
MLLSSPLRSQRQLLRQADAALVRALLQQLLMTPALVVPSKKRPEAIKELSQALRATQQQSRITAVSSRQQLGTTVFAKQQGWKFDRASACRSWQGCGPALDMMLRGFDGCLRVLCTGLHARPCAQGPCIRTRPLVCGICSSPSPCLLPTLM